MTKKINKNHILILDFGSQYAQLVARRVREIGVYCELWKWNVTEKQIREFNPNGIILSGGPESIVEYDSPRAPQYVFEAGVPVFGICYGMQIMAVQLGGYVESSEKREYGYAKVNIKTNSSLTYGIKDSYDIKGQPILNVWMNHNDKVTVIPSDFISVASTENCPFAIIANEKKRFYGVQFHPEVTHTCKGIYIIERFVRKICKCEALWIPIKIIENLVMYLRKKIGQDKVIIGLSGGVDSSVTAVLLHRAIGKNLICIFIDNGLLRLNEAQEIMDLFHDHFNLNIIHIKDEQRFFTALSKEMTPENKRRVIGRAFIEIFEEEALKIKDVKWLAQGTIYPDIIESTVSINKKIHTIKSHHNVGGLPDKMKIKLIEPLRKFFKDEVRKIGLELDIPKDILYRHPFPGPGLGVRVIGKVKKEYCNLLRQADSIFIEELRKANLYEKISQAFTVFLPIRSVGIIGDNRKYGWTVALRAVETVDFMTAKWVHLPFDFLDRVSTRITNEIHEVSRVVYDISNKPPATIEWE